jgi:hypothetical protein
MKRLISIFLFSLGILGLWAGFPSESFDDASAWGGTGDWTGNPVFNGNTWSFYRVDQYASGSDLELKLYGYRPGKVTSHYFENGVGTISFSAAYIDNASADIKVLYSTDGVSFSTIYWPAPVYNYYLPVNSSSPQSYSVEVNNPNAHYIQIQAHYYTVRIDNISVTDYIVATTPTVEVASVSDITKFTASCGGEVTNDGGASVTARGVCWGTSRGPILGVDNFTVDGDGEGAFTSAITGLDANTRYYVRSYATNSVGTSYSNFNLSPEFTTQNYVAPTIVSSGAGEINHSSAVLDAVVNGDEAQTTVTFEYGLTTDYGTQAVASQSPITGVGNQSVSVLLTGLDASSTYHYRVRASNVVGETISEDGSFSTTALPAYTATQSLSPVDPDPEPISFGDTGVTIDFAGVSGATGSDDITVNRFATPPSNTTGLIGSELNISGTSYLFTNHTGFSFSARVDFLIDDIPGVNLAIFADAEDGSESTIKLWKRDEYGSGEFANQGFLRYDDGADNINETLDDLLYLDGISGFSEFTFSSDADHPLPALLSSFSATCTQGVPQLSWVTQSEVGIAGWLVYRGQSSSAWDDGTTLHLTHDSGMIAGAGYTMLPTFYEFSDTYPVNMGSSYWYWLESVDLSGATELFGPVVLQITEEEDDPQTPHPVQQRRMAVYPNPFNPSTEIMLWLSADAVGTVTVYNSRGQRVRTLAQGISIPAETNISIPWDGRDDDGKCVAGGVYYCRFTSSSFAHTRKLLLLK